MNTLLPLTEKDAEYLVDVLDRNWEMCEDVTVAFSEFARFEMTMQQRNELIRKSKYSNDEQLMAALILFG